MSNIPAPVIGQNIRIKLSNEAKEYYRSRVVETSEEYLFIELPLHYKNSEVCSRHEGEVVWIEFHGVDGALCTYQSEVFALLKMPMSVWKVKSPTPSEVQREQRREFVRVPADFPVVLEFQQTSGKKKVTVYSRDVSGGGLSVLIPKDIQFRPGDLVRVTFAVPATNGSFQIDELCTVVRISERNEKGYASASLHFQDIKEAARQRIIQFTFKRQRILKESRT